MAKDGLSEGVTFRDETRMTGEKAISQSQGQSTPGGGRGRCKAPEVRMGLTCCESSEEAGVARAECGAAGGGDGERGAVRAGRGRAGPAELPGPQGSGSPGGLWSAGGQGPSGRSFSRIWRMWTFSRWETKEQQLRRG